MTRKAGKGKGKTNAEEISALRFVEAKINIVMKVRGVSRENAIRLLGGDENVVRGEDVQLVRQEHLHGKGDEFMLEEFEMVPAKDFFGKED